MMATSTPMAERIPKRIFISYSRKDQEWLERLQAHLAPLRHGGSVEPWIDTGKIDYGDRYNDEIRAAIDTSSAAVLLVSPHFQDSSFIRESELPRLLRHANASELKLYWLLVSDCFLADELGATYHCANDSQEALDGMRPAQVNKVLANLARDLQQHVTLQQQEAREAAARAEAERADRERKAREALARAYKDRPFINSLGMKFVPVPGSEILMSVWETRVRDYADFAAASSGVVKCWKNVEYKGHKQGADHPAVNVSWEDAKGFCAWLSQNEGMTYRLPTDHEWSLAVGIGDREDPNASPQSKDKKLQGIFPWGTQWPPPHGAGNYHGEEGADDSGKIEGYRDEHPFTAPVGSYHPNRLGICDLGGNVWEWCQDSYDGNSDSRVLRGASWNDNYRGSLLSSYRYHTDPAYRNGIIGFRVVVGGGER